jgi:energy-converting hydrogenase Eha subunit H
MDPLTCIADGFLLEISPRCSVIKRDLPWKQSELYLFIFSSNSIEYFIANNCILQFTSRNIVTSLFSLANTDIDLAQLRHSTYPSALVSAREMITRIIQRPLSAIATVGNITTGLFGLVK